MRTPRHSFRGMVGVGAVTIVLAGTLALGEAEAQESRRIGIVFSQPSAAYFYDEFTYSQLFMAMQHQAMMAGVPFDVLSEDDLTVAANLDRYNALVAPQMAFVTRSKQPAMLAAISHAVSDHGMGLITAGDFMVYDENGNALPGDPYGPLRELLGVEHLAGVWGVATRIVAGDTSHPAMAGYSAGEQILSYDQLWFDTFRSTGTGSAQLVTAIANGQSFPGVIATRTGGRNVHFANDQILGDADVVWPCIQWVVYGEQAPVALKLGRNASIFSARTDMDQSMYPSELDSVEFPLYDLVAGYKAAYGFVGSFFINIGNSPNRGEYTDWGVSGPLYQRYMALGNEIGTHSWTHPDYTTELTTSQLDFEFRQSAEQIGQQLGVAVLGAAIPGNPEDLRVDRVIAPSFQYVSGRAGQIGWGYPGANGWLSPEFTMLYLSMSMSSDWTLVGWLNYTADEAVQIWRDEYQTLTRHGSQPLVHFLWHDYAATGYPGFKQSMYTDTFAWLDSMGTEFVTAADAQQRIRSFAGAELRVSGTDPLTVQVDAADVGRFSLKMGPGKLISSVEGWYAYDDDQIFLAQGGGQFVTHFGAAPADVTHITELPMRAKLLALGGNGRDLTFRFEGEGVVKARVHSGIVSSLQVEGADSTALAGDTLQMTFGSQGEHTVFVTGVSPTCTDQDIDGFFSEGGSCGLADCDDADPQRFPGNPEVCDGKDNDCSGGVPAAELDADGDLFRVCAGDCDDTNANVNPAKAEVCNDAVDNNCNGMTDAADPACLGNLPPIAYSQSVGATEDTQLSIVLGAMDPEGGALGYSVGQPSHGTLSGVAPFVVYTPNLDYNGPDSFTFFVHDGVWSSGVATVSIVVAAVNDAPVFPVSPVAAADAVATVAYTATIAGSAVDVDGPSLSLAMVSGPGWLQLGPDGALAGTPTAADEGLNTWVIQATDGDAPPVTASLTVTVKPAGVPEAVEATFVSVAAEDGWLRESAETSGIGGSATLTGTGNEGLRVGDDAKDRQLKSIVSFDTSPIPDGAKILGATLLLTRGAIEGTNPLQTHGPCLVDIKSAGFGGSAALVKSDFEALADATGVGVITSQGGLNTIYTTVLTAAALPYINVAGRTQLRLAFSLDDNDDMGSDLIGFYAADTSKAARRPKLVVRYQP